MMFNEAELLKMRHEIFVAYLQGRQDQANTTWHATYRDAANMSSRYLNDIRSKLTEGFSAAEEWPKDSTEE